MFSYDDIARLSPSDGAVVSLTAAQWAAVWIAVGYAQPLYRWIYDEVDKDDLDALLADVLVALENGIGLIVGGYGFPRSMLIMLNTVDWTCDNPESEVYLDGQIFGFRVYTPSPVENDSILTFKAVLPAGSYTLRMLVTTYSNRGIFRWYVDGTLSPPGQAVDLYSASGVLNVWVSSALTVYTDGEHNFSLVNFGKNASATDYMFSGTAIHLRKDA